MRTAATARFGLVALLALTLRCSATSRADPAPVLGFEPTDRISALGHWRSWPDGTTFLDSTIVHEGHYAGRIERSATSPSTFSSFAVDLPVDFTGSTLELRGWLRFEDVAGVVGLWQRQDGRAGSLQFDNMAARNLHGTADWVEYRVTLPLDPKARSVAVGALLQGTGRLWADDLRLYVDGKPLDDASKKPVVRTVLDTDTSFTAGSRIAIESVTAEQCERLVLLGKVWGFLKYHHPAVVRGERQWDFDLFRELPRALAAGDAAAARRELSRWIAELGPVPPCTTCVELPPAVEVAPRLDWLADRERLGDSLSAQLVAIRQRRLPVSEQFFVGLTPYVGNPDFSNELAYWRQVEPDAGYRLLALYRLWNILEYWTPNRDLADRDWDATLREFIPRFLAARTKSAYQLELLALIAHVRDTHANLWSGRNAQPPVGNAFLPVTVRFVERKAVVTGYRNSRLGAASGLRAGDVLAAIDGTPVDTLVARWQPFYPASNPAARLRDMASNLSRGPAGPVRVAVVRDGRQVALQAERVRGDSLDLMTEHRHDYSGPAFRRLSDDLAYLTLSSAKAADLDRYLNGIRDARCLVIDLREYPSDFMVFALGQHLVRSRTPFVKFTVGDLQNPGAFAFRGPPVSIEPAAPYIECPVAILVDETTQSQAEYTTMAFRSRPGTVVVGSQTAGADGNVSKIALPGGQSTMISGIGVFYPDGTPTQGTGIVPDVRVSPTIAGIRAGRDEVLEAAVRRVLGRNITAGEMASLRSPEGPTASRR